MGVINSSNTSSAVENIAILSIVQDELNRAAKLRPTVMDLSGFVKKGDKQVSVPRFGRTTQFAPAAQNVDGTTANAFQHFDLATDDLSLNKHYAIPYTITDRASMQSVVSLEGAAAKSAGEQMGQWMDDQIITQLQSASTATPDHARGLDGGATAAAGSFGLGTVTTARQLLLEQNIENKGDWYMLIPPALEKTLLDLSNFKTANEYGSREGILDGEIGKIYGFRVIVHNGVASNACYFYQKDAMAIAVQQEVSYESRRSSVQLLSQEHVFSILMGNQILDGGRKVVYCLGA